MDMQNETLDTQADRLAKEALHELGAAPFGDPDDYMRQCDYAGCYPWLREVVCAHAHDSPIRAALRDSDAGDEQDFHF